MPTSKVLVSSSTALKIFRERSNRPAANRCSLKAYVERGLITAYPIHSRRFAYDPEQVAAVAAKLHPPRITAV